MVKPPAGGPAKRWGGMGRLAAGRPQILRCEFTAKLPKLGRVGEYGLAASGAALRSGGRVWVLVAVGRATTPYQPNT